MKEVKIDDKWVGSNHPCYTIGEIGGAFHSFVEAKRLIDSASEIGIDAVKFQTFEANTITTKNNMLDLETTGKISQYELFKKNEVPKDLQLKVVNYAKDCGITVFTAPSHIKDIEIIKKMDLPAIKIGSDLACHVPLLKKVAKLEIPIILSTGLCTLEEVKRSVDAITNENNEEIIILHCVADYPTKIEEANLNAITTLKKEFDFPIGYSDHTIGTLASLAAVSLGSNMLERHFRDERNEPGVDDSISLVKEEFRILIDSIQKISKMRGSGVKKPSTSEQKNLLTNRVL